MNLSNKSNISGVACVNLKFKRERKITNREELTKLQQEFENCAAEIGRMEDSKTLTGGEQGDSAKVVKSCVMRHYPVTCKIKNAVRIGAYKEDITIWA